MKDAITKAIEGGYQTPKSKINGVQTDVVIQEVVLLDPLFWQSLSKALGWIKGRNKMKKLLTLCHSCHIGLHKTFRNKDI